MRKRQASGCVAEPSHKRKQPLTQCTLRPQWQLQRMLNAAACAQHAMQHMLAIVMLDMPPACWQSTAQAHPSPRQAQPHRSFHFISQTKRHLPTTQCMPHSRLANGPHPAAVSSRRVHSRSRQDMLKQQRQLAQAVRCLYLHHSTLHRHADETTETNSPVHGSNRLKE